jgi:phosphomannomutase
MDRVVAALEPGAVARDDTDGVSLSFPDWRFNLRRSTTEPLLRLNVEARGDAGLVAAQVARIRALIG